MRLAEIQAHIGSIGALRDIVGAMRSLAGMRLLEAQRMLPGIRRYADAMAEALAATLLLLPETGRVPGGGGVRALILCMAEHGFVGGFNERLAEAADAARAPGDLLFTLGSRGAAAIAGRGGPAPAWQGVMASRAASVPETVRRLASALYDRIARGEIARVEIISARFRQGGSAAITRQRLLPLDPRPLVAKPRRPAPLHNLAPEALLEKLTAEYVFALLGEAAIESVASENAARFAAMESAHDNVSKTLAALREAERQARQEEVTTELLDLVTGAEALNAAPRR